MVIALTTTLAGPQVDALGIEFHQEDVHSACIGVPVQGATGEACDPGIAHGVHLRKDRQLSLAVRRRCTWNLKEKRREKPIKQRKKIVKINDVSNCKSYEDQIKKPVQIEDDTDQTTVCATVSGLDPGIP